MSNRKKGNGGFSNLAAKKFAEDKRKKIELMEEDDIYDILSKESKDDPDITELDIILKQFTDNRKKGYEDKFPKYAVNMFLNISAAKYIHKYVKANRKKFDSDERQSLIQLIVQGFTESASNRFYEAPKDLEREDRHRYLLEAFIMLDKKKHYKLAKKLKLKDNSKDDNNLKTMELVIQAHQEPKYGIMYVCKIIDSSNLEPKKAFKIFKKLYGKRYLEAMGASMCVDSQSQLVPYIFKQIIKLDKKKRKKALRAYAKTFKKIKRYNFFLKSAELKESKSNKRIIRELIKEDRGFKKAFDMVDKSPTKGKGSIDKVSNKKKKSKEVSLIIKK